MAAVSERRIGYLVNSYPVLSETFIRNEIRAVTEAGVDVVVFRLKTPRHEVRDADFEIVGAPRGALAWLRHATAHSWILARQPRAYASTVGRGVLRYLGRFLVRPNRTHRRALGKRCRRFLRAAWVARQASRHGVVHLHAHYAKEPLEVAELVRRLTGIPYSFAAHAKDLYTVPEQRLTRRLRRARFAVACHPEGKRRLERLAPSRRARVLHVAHGLDLSLFSPSDRQRDRDLVLAVGRLTPKKGFEHLLAACARLRQRGRTVRCVIIGDGRCRARLKELRERYQLTDAVELKHSLSQAELVDWYRRAAVFVMPAQTLEDGNRDGIPNVLLEAKACAAPVIGTKVGSIPEIIDDGRDGLLVAPRDPASLANAIERVLDHSTWARDLGAAAARSVAGMDFRSTNRALIEELRPLAVHGTEASFDRVERAAWRDGGVADKAACRLGVEPIRRTSSEEMIRASVSPGVEANSWRPDLDRLVERRLWDEVSKARRTPRLLKALGVSRPGARILDLGCGRGGMSVALAALGHQVVGLDLRYRNCLVTRLRGQRYGLNPATMTAVGERLPLADESIDSVICLEVLEHVLDPIGLLKEIRRVLQPGGSCAITVINRWAHLDPHYQLWWLNFLPAAVAARYIALRRRTKHSYRDLQSLEEMHYFRFRRFVRLANRLGYSVHDPERPEGPVASRFHDLKRLASLGFNTATVVLRPTAQTLRPALAAAGSARRGRLTAVEAGE